jgi:predicted AAA+ superfamily ATPase
MKLVASRVGSVMVSSSLGSALKVPTKTIEKWLTILEASFIIFYASPYYNNFQQRLVSNPKFYFYDTGLMCYLLDIRTPNTIEGSRMGGVFENFIVSETKKRSSNSGDLGRTLYFWNTQKNPKHDEEPYEIDLILDEGNLLKTIEIKSASKLDTSWFAASEKLRAFTDIKKYVIYTGPTVETKSGLALNWRDLDRLLD